MVAYDEGPLVDVEAKAAALKYRLTDFITQIVSPLVCGRRDDLLTAPSTLTGWPLECHSKSVEQAVCRMDANGGFARPTSVY